MWDFLTNLLSAGGVSVTLFAVAIGGFALALRVLWIQHEKALAKLAETNAALIVSLDSMQKQIAELQEKRLADSVKFTERVIEHVNRMDRSLERMGASIETIHKVVHT